MTFNLTLQEHVPVIIGITVALCVLVLIAYRKLKSYDPLEEPKGLVLLCIMFVQWVDGMVKDIVSEDYVDRMGPFVGMLASYILLSNYIGLLGFPNPTLNFSCTLAITLVVWIIFQATDIRYKGVGGYVKSYFEPVFLFVISNVFSALAPLISMSMRLFGNILSGSIIMTLLYKATGALSAGLIPSAPSSARCCTCTSTSSLDSSRCTSSSCSLWCLRARVCLRRLLHPSNRPQKESKNMEIGLIAIAAGIATLEGLFTSIGEGNVAAHAVDAIA